MFAISRQFHSATICDRAVNAFCTTKSSLLVHDCPRVAGELLPLEKGGEFRSWPLAISDLLRKVIAQNRDHEVSYRVRHSREVSDNLPTKSRPDPLQAQWVARAFDLRSRIEGCEKWCGYHEDDSFGSGFNLTCVSQFRSADNTGNTFVLCQNPNSSSPSLVAPAVERLTLLRHWRQSRSAFQVLFQDSFQSLLGSVVEDDDLFGHSDRCEPKLVSAIERWFEPLLVSLRNTIVTAHC